MTVHGRVDLRDSAVASQASIPWWLSQGPRSWSPDQERRSSTGTLSESEGKMSFQRRVPPGPQLETSSDMSGVRAPQAVGIRLLWCLPISPWEVFCHLLVASFSLVYSLWPVVCVRTGVPCRGRPPGDSAQGSPPAQSTGFGARRGSAAVQ